MAGPEAVHEEVEREEQEKKENQEKNEEVSGFEEKMDQEIIREEPLEHEKISSEKDQNQAGGRSKKKKKDEERNELKLQASFPSRLGVKRPRENPVDFLSIFEKLEVNIPFLQALRLPAISKFVKDFIAGKAQQSGKVMIEEHVSIVIQKKLPSKCIDPGMFSLPIWIGNMHVKRAMCDLGASINVLPFPLYSSLKGGTLAKTRVVIQLANRSCVYPEGVPENVLVKVHDFVYPADYVIKMSDVTTKESGGVLLGRPFLRIAKTVINVHDGTIYLDYRGEKFTFNIDEAMKQNADDENANHVDVIELLVQDYLETELVQDQQENASLEMKAELEAVQMCNLFSAKNLTCEEITEEIIQWCEQRENKEEKQLKASEEKGRDIGNGRQPITRGSNFT